MRVALVAVGRVRGPVAVLIDGYEERARHYFTFESVEVREEAARRPSDVPRVLAEEGKRLLARVPPGHELVALHREGRGWSSVRLSRYLAGLAVSGSPGASFVIGGAFGLSDEVLARATHRLSLSDLTLPHEIARLVLAEQLYRAGTIQRGEPYHKGRDLA